MKTTDLFKTSSKKLNESIEKTFGRKLNLESFDLPKLEDARNKLRTQLSQVRSETGFNENLDNEAYLEAQWMLDAINAEIAERQEFIADPHQAAVEYETNEGSDSMEDRVMALLKKFDQNANEIGGYGDPDAKKIIELLKQGDVEGAAEEVFYAYSDQDGGELPEIEPYVDDLQDEFEALAQGDDEDYYSLPMPNGDREESVDFDKIRSDAEAHLKKSMDKQSDDRIAKLRANKEREDEPFMQQVGRKIIGGVKGAVRGFSGKEDVAMEKAPPTAKGERMVKHIKQGYADDGKLTDKEKSIAYATAWKQHNKDKNESIESGEDMTTLREGEVQQASAIVTAKTMVDRVSRWIEELSGMENDTLLQLGDSIRDEMSQEQAKTFISAVAPAIQQALQNLKDTRETLATGVRTLTGEEQGAEMLGAEPGAEGGDEMGGMAEPDAMNAGGEDELGALGGAEDEFAAAEPAAGGLEAAGREQRESIDRSSSLLKVLAG